ncbi:MAG: hypothetical protein ABW022_08935, partial [Actinoplanes sp.]
GEGDLVVLLAVGGDEDGERAPVGGLGLGDAVEVVEDGAEGGEIRSDVATDLRNLIRNLSTADGRDVTGQVAQLRQKIRQRAGEGSVSSAHAAVLQARLNDLSRATGT